MRGQSKVFASLSISSQLRIRCARKRLPLAPVRRDDAGNCGFDPQSDGPSGCRTSSGMPARPKLHLQIAKPAGQAEHPLSDGDVGGEHVIDEITRPRAYTFGFGRASTASGAHPDGAPDMRAARSSEDTR